jgi:hypothetical protein
MNTLNNLSEEETEALLKFPAYMALIAANYDDNLDQSDKKKAIEFAHIKTFSCDPLLSEFYHEADIVFKSNIEQLDMELPHAKELREEAIKKELLKLDKLVSKMGTHYASTMYRSMDSFKHHISKHYHNVLLDFVFPLPIHGLTNK